MKILLGDFKIWRIKRVIAFLLVMTIAILILKGFLTFSVGGFVYTILDKYDGIQDGKWTIC